MHVEILNDSKQIGLCVYNVVIATVIIVPLQFVLTADQMNVAYIIMATGILLCATGTLVIVFAPKVSDYDYTVGYG